MPCTPCPLGSTTPPGSNFTNITACSAQKQPTTTSGDGVVVSQLGEGVGESPSPANNAETSTSLPREGGAVHVAAAAACFPGQYFASVRQGCKLCPKGSYSAGGSTSCKKCHPHYTTAKAGATSADACTGCAPGYGSRVDSPGCVCGSCLQGTYSGACRDRGR